MLRIHVSAFLAATAFATATSAATTSTAATSAAAGAATLSRLPACAQDCLQNAATTADSCSSVDVACLCNDITFLTALSCCLASNCDEADGAAAANFNIQLCASSNVTVPYYSGCVESLSTLPGGQVTTIYSDTTAGVGPTATTTAAGILGSIEPGPSIATTGPVATFTGEAILEGSCTVPRYASVTMGTGQGEVYLEYPWLGCSLEEPDCCPFDSKVGGQLSVCPSDYFTTSGACCPSGWSVYTSELAGQTPCFTPTTVSAIIPTSISNSSSSASTSIINTQLFALRYSLQQSKQSSTLSTGAKAGIAVGAAGGAALALLALALFIRKRRGRARARRDEATVPGFKGPTDAHAYSHKPTPSELPSPYSQGPVSELPSPTTMRSPTPPLPDNAMWFPLRSHKPPGPPTELVGSTYINEHHPAYSPITSPTAFHAQSDGFLNEVEHKPPAELDVGKA